MISAINGSNGVFKAFGRSSKIEKKGEDEIALSVRQLGSRTLMPGWNRNYCEFDNALVGDIVAKKEKAIPYLKVFLERELSEKQVAEGLYTLDRMIDDGVRGIGDLYPTLARYNNTQSPTVQVLLAGIYRKTLVPDAFGPLCRMLIRDAVDNKLPMPRPFDPAEEVGGAILEYLRNTNASRVYSKATLS